MSLEKATTVLVTARNHEWAAEASGMSIEWVHAHYQKSLDAGNVCVIVVLEKKEPAWKTCC